MSKRDIGETLSTCLAFGGRCFIAALMVLHSAPAQAQAAGDVLRPWNCLTNSVAVGSGFFTTVTPLGCIVPAVTWSGPAPASAIIPPGTPFGLTATVTGHTVVLTWAPPTTGGTPTSYLAQAGTATGLANLVSANTESAPPTLTTTHVPAGTYFFPVLAPSASGT